MRKQVINERHTRSFVRLKKINARLKKSEGARVRARQKRERERERKQSHSPSWKDSPPRRATLRRSCLPLWKVSFKNADFLKKKTSHPPSFEPSTERPQKKKKGKKQLSSIPPLRQNKNKESTASFRYPIHSFIHSGARLSAIYI